METNYTVIFGHCNGGQNRSRSMQNTSLCDWKEGRDIFNTYTFAEAEKDKLDTLLEKFENYCIPKKNVTMERHKFNTRTQGSTELIEKCHNGKTQI